LVPVLVHEAAAAIAPPDEAGIQTVTQMRQPEAAQHLDAAGLSPDRPRLAYFRF